MAYCRRSEYQKLIGTSRMVAIGLSKAIINYAPLGLTKEEKERLKEDVPTFLQMRFMTGINNFIARIFISAFAAAFALLGTVVLMKQNEKLEVQINIEEANRQSSLVFLMSNIMDKVDEELKDTFNTNHNTRKLTKQTVGRIAALSQSLKPYYYLQNGELIAKPLSPERGQLLLNLVKSNFDKKTYYQIYNQTTFQDADLQNAKLSFVILNNVNLSYANLSSAEFIGAILTNVNLSLANFNKAKLSGIKFIGTDLSYAKFHNALLDGSHFNNVDLSFADFSYANLSYANLNDTLFISPDIFGIKHNGANLYFTKFIGADLSNTNLRLVRNLETYQISQAKTLYKCKFPKYLATEIEELKKRNHAFLQWQVATRVSINIATKRYCDEKVAQLYCQPLKIENGALTYYVANSSLLRCALLATAMYKARRTMYSLLKIQVRRSYVSSYCRQTQ